MKISKVTDYAALNLHCHSFTLRILMVWCYKLRHMGQYKLLSVLSPRLSPLNIDHSRNLPVENCGMNYTEKYATL